MPVIHSWQPTASIAPILQSLKDGGCVVLPTESTYEVVASVLCPDALARLQSLTSDEVVPTVIIADEWQLRDWLPLLRGAGSRMYRKLGPGPMIVRADAGCALGLWQRLPEAARQWLLRDRLLAMRWPAHPIWADLRSLDLPLVSVALPSAITAQAAAELLGEQAACVVDAGPTEFGRLPTRVRVNGQACHLEREGGLSAAQIQQLALSRVLFVCTGNTCRSPMAEALCAKLLADRLGCAAADLDRHGFSVQSAGLAAMMGHQASPEAVVVVAQQGADLAAHRSRTVTMEMLGWADHVFAMTATHLYTLKHVPITGIPMPRLLSPQGEDVADPIGGELADYQACANQIRACLQQRLPELLES